MSKVEQNKEMPASRQAVLVVGMHRSGTSAVSRALNVLGCFVGDNLMPASQDNEKGYWEDLDIVTYNDSLLAESYSSWDLPLMAKQGIDESSLLLSHGDDARSLINGKFSKYERIAIKDPRVSMLLPFWSEQLKQQGFSVKVVLCLRHPQAVADSLNRRDGFSDKKSYQLWCQYNLTVLAAVEGDLIVVDYDSVLKEPEKELLRIGKFLGLSDSDIASAEMQKTIKTYCSEFIDSGLCHVNKNSMQRYDNAPGYIDSLYKELLLLCKLEEQSGDDCQSIIGKISEYNEDVIRDHDAILVDELIDRGKSLAEAKAEMEASKYQLQQAEHIRNITSKESIALKEANSGLLAANHAQQETNVLLNRENERLRELITKVDAKLTVSETERSNLNQQLQLRYKEIQGWSETVNAIKASTSWRVTAPIRGLVGGKNKLTLTAVNAYKFITQRGIRTSVDKCINIYRTEGLLGIKTRLKFGPRVLVGTAPVSSTGVDCSALDLPVAIVRGKNGEYSIEKGAAQYTYITPRRPENIVQCIERMKLAPLFSILVPTYNTELKLLDQLIASVDAQWYSRWQLIFVDDASPSVKTREYLANINHKAINVIQMDANQGIAGATNTALAAATGDYIVLLDHDDELTVDCLYELALKIDSEAPDFIYSDEDKISPEGNYFQPHFKPSWSPDTMMSTMYTCHVACFKREILEQVGGLRSEYDGCQDWDLVLRVTENTDRIAHIPKVLYHWRVIPESIASDIAAKPYVLEATQKVRADAMERRGLKGSVEPIEQVPGYFRVNYHLQGEPLISIIIPTRDNEAVLRRCIDSIIELTAYKHYEIIILDNGSVDEAALSYFEELGAIEKIKIIRHDEPFNYSELNNIGAKKASGELYLFLNDDTEILQAGWLNELGGYAQLPHIGAVGAKLLYPNSNTNQHAGILNLSDGPGHAFLNQDADSPGYFMRNLLDYNWLAVTGACLMINAEKYDDLLGFNEDFPIAYNDVDLCMRLRDAGYYNVVCQSVRLTHYESVSRGVDHIDPEKLKRLEKERGRLYQNHSQYFQHDPFYNVNLHPNNVNFEMQQ